MTIDHFLNSHNLKDPYEILNVFEQKLANFFGSKYAVLTDCCTHAIELSLRLTPPELIVIPKHTYVSIPMTAIKLHHKFKFVDVEWSDYYHLGGNIYDAAVLWKRNSYIPGSKMCVSFQHKKHINIGRGGCILLDDLEEYTLLKKMRHDGRDPTVEHQKENISVIGYHYYLTPESALKGIELFDVKKDLQPRIWTNHDYADLTQLDVFKSHE
jgi:dTDP-4-amino-4,6-dideoxygalactose transaminase